MKQTLKRLLSMAVALFLVISMIPATALPVLAAEETSAPAQQAETEASTQSIVYPEGWSVEYHCVCGNPSSTDNPCAKEGHKMVQWQPWTVQGVAPFREGYWYLTEDITSVNANQFPYGTDFKTNTAIIGRDQVNGATALLGKQVSVYVDLNGKTVTGNTNHRIFRLENDFAHNLTITDTVGTGKLVPKGGAGNSGMGIWTRNTGSRVTIYGGTIDGSAAALTSGSGSVISNCATVEIYGGKIIGGKVTIASGSALGGSIYNTGTLNIYGGTIEGGTATASAGDVFGGIIYSNNKLNIYGGTIKGGTVNSPVGGSGNYARGGTIANDSTMNIYGGTIEGGTANGYNTQGGTIFNNNGKTLNIYGGTITGGLANSTTGVAQGGVIRNQGKLNIYGGTISGGTATTTGGTTQGCTVSNVSTFYMENGTIEGGTAKATTAAGVGAALFSTTGGTMKGGTIIGGYCYKGSATASGACGGAIYVYGGTFTMDGGTIKAKSYTANVAYQGGAVFVRNTAKFVLNDGVVAAGKVNDYGGAIATQGGGTITINGGVVTGTFYADGTPVTDPADANATGVVKVNNSAGAAVGAWGGTINMTGGTIIGGQAGNVGGGVAVRSGAVFNMSGGLITGGKAVSGSYKGGGNVAVDYQNSSRPSFIMTGGTITGGTGVYPGVMVNRGGQISISGDAVITGNRDDNGAECNLALLDDNGSGASYGLKLNIGEMGSKASVGISMAKPGVFSDTITEANAAAFFGDSGCYIQQLEDGTLQLVNGHQAHCVCGGSDTHSGCDHTALEGEWKPWDGKSPISEGGNYYLTQSVVGDYQRWMGGVYGNTTVMTINLCLNGHSIDNTKNGNRALGIAANVTVNLMNCSHCESVLTGGCKDNSGTAAFLYTSTSKLNMYDNVKIVAAPGVQGNISGAVHVPTGATFNMYGGELVGGYVKSTGGAVNVGANATFNLYDGKISGGNAAGGGNINLDKGAKFTMYGGEIVGGVSRQTHGGNIYVREDVVATILGGVIRDGVVTIPEGATGDAADKNGGNIAMVDQDNDDLGALIIGGDVVIKNGSANRGGNIFIHTGSLTIKDNVKIEGGTALAIYNSNGTNPSVEINWGRSEATANNRTYLAISGNPQINSITYNDWIDTTGLGTDAQIGLLRTVGGKVSSGVLSAAQAACFTSIKKNIKLINEEDALYAHKPTYVAATEASCHQDGHAEHWYCERCDVYYADENMTQITNIKNLAIEAAPLTYVAAQEPSCHQNGHAEYWYCAECEAIFTDAAGMHLTNIKNLAIEAAPLVYVAAVDPTCHQNGCAEYWYCAECDAVFADAAGMILTNRKNLTIEAAPLTYVAAQDATCHQRGHAEYWYCMECEAIFADAAGTQLTNIKNISTPALLGLTHVAAQEASCHQAGHAEYWYCMECEAIFADAAGTMLTNIKNLAIPALVGLTHVPAQEASCHQNGHAEYWYCMECEAVFADAAGTQLTNIKNLAIEAAPLVYVAAQEPSCHQDGNAEYWYCAECDAVFADAAGVMLTNRKNLEIPAEPLTYVPALDASCHQKGHSEYWYCMECEAIFADAAGTMLTNIKNISTPALIGLTHVAAQEASCHQAGHAEYWYCMECEAVFADAAGMQLTNIKNLSTPALVGLTHVAAQEPSCHQDGHAEYWYCTECEAVFADAAGTILTNRKNLEIPAADLIYVAAQDATCHQRGHAEYWYCAECDAIFADAAGTMLTNIKNISTPALVGLTHVEAQEATCHQRGHAEYWYCAECEAIFADAAGTMLTNIKNISTPALVGLTYVAALEPSCHQDGYAEYWYCTECDVVFADAAGTILTNRKNLEIPAADLIYVAAEAADYGKAGHYEYWYCAECDAVFADAAGVMLTNRKNLTIPALEIPELPSATITMLENDQLTFAMNFLAVAPSEAQLDCYGDWYADFVLTINKDVVFNANGEADGYLGGQYDAWSSAWVYVPFENVTMKANESLKIMEYAAKLMNKEGLKLTYNDVVSFVKDFDCGVYFDPEFLTANPDLVVTLELRMFNPENEAESYVIGETFEFNAPNFVASITDGEGNVTKYPSLAAAIAAAGTEAVEIDLIDNITLNSGLVINKGQNITLDLNGYTVTYTSNLPGDDMITNRGNLTITDSAEGGKLTYVNTDTTAYNVTVSTISTEAGSVLVIDGGIIENKTVYTTGIYAYAIDALTNGTLGDVYVTINDGTVYSDYAAIRQFNNGTACINSLTINGGYIYAAGRAIQSHMANNAAHTTITGGKMEAGQYVLCLFATEAPISITGGEFIGLIYSATADIISGGTYNDSELFKYADYYCAEGFTVKDNGDGTYGIEEEQILVGPEDQSGLAGKYVTFTVTDMGEGYIYQWQYSVNGGKGWFNSTSATQGYNTNELTVKVEAIRDGFLYRCRITDPEGNKVYTDPATLHVLTNDAVQVAGPENVEINVGEYATFTVVAKGEGTLHYRWQYSTNGGQTWLKSTAATQGYNTAELVVEGDMKRNGFLYRCVVIDEEGNEYLSDTVTLTVVNTAVTDPEDQVAAAGNIVTFTASVEAEVVSYKWEYSVNGGKGWFSSTFAGCDTASMDVVATEARDGFMYRCRIVTVDGEVIVTEPATLTVQ